MLPIEGTSNITATSSTIGLQAPTPDFLGAIRFLYTSLISEDWNSFAETVEFWWNVYSVIAIVVSLILFIGFVYAQIRYSQLSAIEAEGLREQERKWAARHSRNTSKNARWESLQLRVSENSPESWRVAIIEADIMLEEVLSNAGYVGQSLGEKLKSANSSSFTTLQDAWDAHKVRNEIAHVGSDFILTKKAAQETILRFERVFREFGAI